MSSNSRPCSSTRHLVIADVARLQCDQYDCSFGHTFEADPVGGNMAEPESRIPLADLVNAVRAELETASVNARNQQLQFEVQDVQLEVEVMTTGTREAGGGLQVWVLTVGAKGSKANAATQKVTLNLSAVTRDGTKFRVSDISSKPTRQK